LTTKTTCKHFRFNSKIPSTLNSIYHSALFAQSVSKQVKTNKQIKLRTLQADEIKPKLLRILTLNIAKALFLPVLFSLQTIASTL